MEHYDDTYGRIKAVNVENTIRKYLGLSFKNHKSAYDYKFENGYYVYGYATWDTPDFSYVTNLVDNGGGKFSALVEIYSTTVVDGNQENCYEKKSKWVYNTEKPKLVKTMTADIQKMPDGSYVLLDYMVEREHN
ncbi:hypothetical protein [Pseudobacteroides cellulosolvens]|uniref:Uncharacterized protein n=1 Tax=Pseudobacteroides cellulosolvens ATCC 35603 = DSM 2933 TaxID=398512 RepID=A0A0L6JTY9_9FIRM|nr:hypothetical protein [Pseudobacteroides cellulosolvens]KNY28887.1 hypothetical protein Bccel_4161 [Pseudobacteroides cellulosolvens ATCC 35603 = DSM 2933]